MRLHIVHPNRLLRECLASVFSRDEQFQVEEIDPEDDGYRLHLQERDPHVILIDVNYAWEEATETIRWIRVHLPQTKVLALVSSRSEENLVDLVATGVHGCVLEHSSLDELRAAIDSVVEGQSFCSREMIQSLFSQFAKMAHETHWRQQIDSIDLTRRELEILGMISEHLGNKQIAKRLCISLNTVKNHVHNILDKLQVSSRFEAVEYAKRRKWLAEGSRRWE